MSLRCPDCSAPMLAGDRTPCPGCGWTSFVTDGILDVLPARDRVGDLSRRYIENYEELARKNLAVSNIDRRFLRNQARNLVRYLGSHVSGDACDVGIGQGFLCDLLLERGVASLAAVDVSRSYLSRWTGVERVTPYLANAESLPFEDAFDLVTATDVMEHVLNVGSFMFSLNRALRLGGIAAIRVPYREGLLDYSHHRGYAHAFGHLRNFNKDTLSILLRQAGFRVRRFHLDGFSPGTPQPMLYSTPRRKALYHRIQRWMETRLEHPADATLWPSWCARMLMRPVEIAVIARKERSI